MIIMIESRNYNNKTKQYINKIKDMLCDIEDCIDEESSSTSRSSHYAEDNDYIPRRRVMRSRYEW